MSAVLDLTSLSDALVSMSLGVFMTIIQKCKCVLNHFSHVQLFATLWTIAHQAPLSMGHSGQEYWSRLPCSPPGYLPNPGIEFSLLHWQVGSLLLAPPRNASRRMQSLLHKVRTNPRSRDNEGCHPKQHPGRQYTVPKIFICKTVLKNNPRFCYLLKQKLTKKSG